MIRALNEGGAGDGFSAECADWGEMAVSLLASGGPLSEVFERTFLDRTYEEREGQLTMTRAVGQSFLHGRHLAVEAGTGTGKTFAYLLPAMLAAASGRKVILSTHTLALQDQILHKDMPLIEAAWKEAGYAPVSLVLLKGRRNYVCRRRLANAIHYKADLFERDATDQLEQLVSWVEENPEGTLQDIPFPVEAKLWDEVCAEDDLCRFPGQKGCQHCLYPKRWAAADEAGVILVNHALFFSDLGVRLQGGALLPDYHHVVFDEAHELESVAANHLGIRVTEYTVNHWLRRLSRGGGRRGLFRVLAPGNGRRAVDQALQSVQHWFTDVGAWLGDEGEAARTTRELDTAFPRDTPLPGQLMRLSRAMLDLAEEDRVPGALRGDWLSAARRGQALADAMNDLLQHPPEGHVQWVEGEMRGAHKRLAVCSVPVDVGPVMQSALYERISGVVHCSATLSWQGRMGYFSSRIGLEDAEEKVVPSPFQLAEQITLWVDEKMPEPADAGYLDALAERIPHAVDMTQGGALVLFTNTRHMVRTVELARAGMERRGYTVFVQGEDPSRERLMRRFAEADQGVLFGLATFWTGIDVPGDALRNVIITRLPFAVPDHPLVRARMERIEDEGESSFMAYSLPEAALKFRQGVGRLIRSTTDTGQVVVLDRRVTGKWYGRFFRIPGVSIQTVP